MEDFICLKLGKYWLVSWWTTGQEWHLWKKLEEFISYDLQGCDGYTVSIVIYTQTGLKIVMHQQWPSPTSNITLAVENPRPCLLFPCVPNYGIQAVSWFLEWCQSNQHSVLVSVTFWKHKAWVSTVFSDLYLSAYNLIPHFLFIMLQDLVPVGWFFRPLCCGCLR